jgi:siroheme synthase-like protein
VTSRAGLSRAATVSARIGALATLPVFLKLEGRRVLLVGGGDPALWKAELLAAAGADVVVRSDDPGDGLLRLAAATQTGSITVLPMPWGICDLFGAALAIGAFEDAERARVFAASVRSTGVPVNVIDKPEFCDFQFGALVNRSPLVVAISTDGAAPVFGQAIRARIETLLPAGFQHWAIAAKTWRARFQATAPDFRTRRRFWETFATRALDRPDTAPCDADFDACFAAASETARAGPAAAGRVQLLGIAAVSPELSPQAVADLLTLKAVRLLGAADVVVHDRGVPATVLDFARREAQRVDAADASIDTVQTIADYVLAGKTVVRVAVDRRQIAVEATALSAAGPQPSRQSLPPRVTPRVPSAKIVAWRTHRPRRSSSIRVPCSARRSQPTRRCWAGKRPRPCGAICRSAHGMRRRRWWPVLRWRANSGSQACMPSARGSDWGSQASRHSAALTRLPASSSAGRPIASVAPSLRLNWPAIRFGMRSGGEP